MDNVIVFFKKNLKVELNEKSIILTNGKVRVTYDKADGTADIYDVGKLIGMSRISAETILDDGTKLSSKSMKRNFPEGVTVSRHKDGFGEGVKLTIHNSEDGYLLSQNFYAYTSCEFILMDSVITSQKAVKTNYMAPLAAQLVECAAGGDLRFLSVPFDNDDFIRYSSQPLAEAKESYEITSIFDNDTRKGLVVGSVSHDTWKTGIRVEQGSLNELAGFTVFGGITSKKTRDTLPHGFVTGETVSSSKIFLGFFDDYRDGMEAYGKANAVIAPPLPWDKGIPMGWNSWSAVAFDINYDIYVNASDFVKEHLQSGSFDNHGVYINFDSGWNNLTEEQLIDAAKYVNDNGQIPGIYTTPFTYWGKDFDRPVMETEGLYTWRDLVLKDDQGNILPSYDGGYSIDPTHPGNYMRMKHQFENFRKWGYQYVKLDFMSHGTVEGTHFNKDITTGVAAYNYGMQQLVDIMREELEKQEFFISLSIAPLFPSQYAHSRRISCDIFGTINFAEYMLNSLTFGWWMNDSVYKFNDPDHIVVYNSYNHLDPILYNEGLTRYISSAIAGTMMIDSDDFRIEDSKNRTKEILTNAEINKVARAGKTFRPVEGNTEDKACDCFVRRDEKEQVTYLAVFNYSATERKEKLIDLGRIGLDKDPEYVMYDLCTQHSQVIQSSVIIEMCEAEPKLYKIYRK
ncbi:MAG TPA: hypothetical protein VN258_09565 [Mobilitalea sp.]|nr:hypothetical protein [Mobilitalea sp.]